MSVRGWQVGGRGTRGEQGLEDFFLQEALLCIASPSSGGGGKGDQPQTTSFRCLKQAFPSSPTCSTPTGRLLDRAQLRLPVQQGHLLTAQLKGPG